MACTCVLSLKFSLACNNKKRRHSAVLGPHARPSSSSAPPRAPPALRLGSRQGVWGRLAFRASWPPGALPPFTPPAPQPEERGSRSVEKTSILGFITTHCFQIQKKGLGREQSVAVPGGGLRQGGGPSPERLGALGNLQPLRWACQRIIGGGGSLPG